MCCNSDSLWRSHSLIRRDGRRIELDQILGKATLAHERAAEMRTRGNFAGEIILSRIAVDKAERHPVTCRDELDGPPGPGGLAADRLVG